MITPDEYIAALVGWRRKTVEHLRATVREAAALSEVIKWGHLVYFSNGPLLLIRAEEERVLFGFWRAWHTWRAGADDAAWLAAAGVAKSMAAGAVVLGYYFAYWIGVRRRIRRHLVPRRR